MSNELKNIFNQEHWDKYSSLFEESWSNSEEQTALLKALSGNKKISMVIWGHLESNSMSWIHSKIPALDYLKPIDCLKNDELKSKLINCLMRFPC
jgi:hypothetical protein